MCTKNQLYEILNTLNRIYSDVYGTDIDQIILYGSYARGEEHGDSDLDVAAIVHGDRETLQSKLYQVWDASTDLELKYDTILSPTVIPYDEFNRYKNDLPYYRNIDKEGVRLNG